MKDTTINVASRLAIDNDEEKETTTEEDQTKSTETVFERIDVDKTVTDAPEITMVKDDILIEGPTNNYNATAETQMLLQITQQSYCIKQEH